MSTQSQFKHLFTPIKVGPVTLKNRIMTTAHGTGFVDPNPALGYPGHPGLFNERYAYYLAERAKGGCGLVMFGDNKVHPTSAYQVHTVMSCAWPIEAVPLIKLSADKVHEAGGKIFCQLTHSGAHSSGRVAKHAVWAASETPGLGSVTGREGPKIMEIEDIEECIEFFCISAKNCRDAGFDGIELHGGTSYLPHQFHSPLWNKRTDKYGGSLENRMRFSLELVERVKKTIGPDMALGWRLTVDDFMPGGLGVEDMQEIAQILEETGHIDYFNNNPGFHGGAIGMAMYEPHCTLVSYAAALKEVVSVPVVAVGRVVHPLEAEKILADGLADLIGMTRAHIADPELANKAKEGRMEEIRHCTGCLQLCLGNVTNSLPCDCTQNPTVGREKQWGIGTVKPAETKKRITVVGGGPAGLEVAWVAASRGHDVTLYEKSQELGGQIKLAAKLPGRGESEEWVRFRKVMVAKHGVKVVLGKEITAEDVLGDNPDAVVLANGSTPYRNGFQGVTGFAIPGWENANVMVVEDVLEGKEVPTDKVVILDEDALVKGSGVAEMLAGQGKQVEIVDRHAYIGSDCDSITGPVLLGRLARAGVKMSAGTFIHHIDADSVTLTSVYDYSQRVVEGPVTVLMCTGNKANDVLYYALKGKVKELHRIGDCLAARPVGSAIYDGYKLGRNI